MSILSKKDLYLAADEWYANALKLLDTISLDDIYLKINNYLDHCGIEWFEDLGDLVDAIWEIDQGDHYRSSDDILYSEFRDIPDDSTNIVMINNDYTDIKIFNDDETAMLQYSLNKLKECDLDLYIKALAALEK